MISKTLEDIEKDIKYLKEIANEEYFKKVEELCEKVNARSDKLQDRIDKAINYVETHKYPTPYGFREEDLDKKDLIDILKGE